MSSNIDSYLVVGSWLWLMVLVSRPEPHSLRLLLLLILTLEPLRGQAETLWGTVPDITPYLGFHPFPALIPTLLPISPESTSLMSPTSDIGDSLSPSSPACTPQEVTGGGEVGQAKKNFKE